MIKKISVLLTLLLLTMQVIASEIDHPLYAGGSLGYGSTNWQGLVNQDKDYASSVLETVPEKVQDRGLDYGFFVGYTFTPHYALELSYRKFRTSTIYFNTEYSAYVNPDGSIIPGFRSATTNTSLVNKFMIPLTSDISVFSGLGPGITSRQDILAKATSQIVATFVVGVNYDVTSRIMTTLEGDYTTGMGESEFYPVYHYIPFLYSLDLKLAYRF